MKHALAVLSLALAACATAPNRPVGSLPPHADVWWFTLGRDGSTWAYTERQGANAWLVAGDRRYGPHP